MMFVDDVFWSNVFIFVGSFNIRNNQVFCAFPHPDSKYGIVNTSFYPLYPFKKISSKQL